MKKLLSVILCFLMLLSVISLAGCGGSKETLKLGFGVHSYIEEIKNADGENNGSGEATTTVAAVLLDKDGKIVKCEIDTAANAIAFTANGAFVKVGELKTKYEAGKDYNMVAYGGAKKEWFEQADAFESVVIGKNLEEVKALKVDGNKGNDEVVNAGCTIIISDFIIAIEKAVNNAVDSKATADDTLQLGIVSSQAYDSKDATDEANGVNEIDTTMVAVALDKDGVITAAATDSVVTTIEFDTKGVSKTEYGVVINSKKATGKDYGMAQYGNDLNGDGTVKEWYEQADVFSAELVGKKQSDIAGLANDKGYGSDALQTAGCTINVNDMVKAAAKAATVK